MTTQVKIIIGVVLLLGAFAFGRYTKKPEIITEYKDKIVEKIVKETDTKQDKHKTTVVVVKPDGSKTTTIDEDTKTDSSTTTVTNKDETIDDKKTIKNSTGLVVGVLAGTTSSDLFKPMFGGFIDKQVLGPIHVELIGFGSTSLGVGGMLGLGFEF